MNPKEELEKITAEHEVLKATVADLEKGKSAKRHMAFPTGDTDIVSAPLAGFAQPVVQEFNAGNIDQLVKEFKAPNPAECRIDDLVLVGNLLRARGEELPEAYRQRLHEGLDDVALRTMTTGAEGTGAELIESPILAKLWTDVVLKAKTSTIFQPLVTMPGKTFDLPVMNDARFYKPAGEGHAVTATDLATAKRTLTAYPIKAQIDISDELNEDSVIALLPAIRAKLIENAAREIDKLVMLADTVAAASGNINSDDAAPAADSDYLLGFDGLIKYALTVAGQASSLGQLAVTDFGALMMLLGKYAVDVGRLAWISDWYSYLLAVQLADFQTVDKLGDKATLLTGQIGAIYNIPWFVIDAMDKVDDDGKYTTIDPTANNTDGRLVLVHRDMWKVGIRKPARVATERSEAKGLSSLVCHMRLALIPFNADGNHTALGYDVTA